MFQTTNQNRTEISIRFGTVPLSPQPEAAIEAAGVSAKGTSKSANEPLSWQPLTLRKSAASQRNTNTNQLERCYDFDEFFLFTLSAGTKMVQRTTFRFNLGICIENLQSWQQRLCIEEFWSAFQS